MNRILMAASPLRRTFWLAALVLLLADTPPPSAPGARWTEPKSGLEFVALPGGTFHFGCEPQDAQCADNERPGRRATVQPFWLGTTDVTVAAYAKCVAAGACVAPNVPSGKDDWSRNCNWRVNGRENHPVNCINWLRALTFCRWIGGRLPTAEEWEYAAKGGESRIYPWGDDTVTGQRANFCDRNCRDALPESAKREWEYSKWIDDSQDDDFAATSPVGSYPAGISRFGLLDMAGNVLQWTSTNYDASTKEARGGSWNNLAQFLRASYRYSRVPANGNVNLGMRCAL